jgi:hypothetical protein
LLFRFIIDVLRICLSLSTVSHQGDFFILCQIIMVESSSTVDMLVSYTKLNSLFPFDKNVRMYKKERCIDGETCLKKAMTIIVA